MEGSGRGRQPPLEVQREFAASRLEKQILIRVFELVVPVVRHSLEEDDRAGANEVGRRRDALSIAKGA